jgi:TolA-binding protein
LQDETQKVRQLEEQLKQIQTAITELQNKINP